MAPLNKNRSIANRAAALALWEAKFPLKKIREATGYSERQIRRIRTRAAERGYDPKSSTGFRDEYFKDELRPGRRGKKKGDATTGEDSTTTAAAAAETTAAAIVAAIATTTTATTTTTIGGASQVGNGGEKATAEGKKSDKKTVKDGREDDEDTDMDGDDD